MAKKQTNTVWTIAGLMLGMLLATLDQTIVSTAMPSVVKHLGGISLYSWVFSIYMLTSTTSMPIMAKLADLYGRKRFFIIGMVIFMAGSALCGMSSNMMELIAFRGFQGIGAAALMPLAVTILGDILPPERRAKMQGMFGAVMALSSIIGPAIGGFITEHMSWQWVFYVNLPVGIAAIAVLMTALHENRAAEKRSIDWVGAIVLSGSIISLLLALVLGGDGGAQSGTHYAWSSPQIIGLFVASAVLLGLFLWTETKAKEPIIPLQLFRNRVVTVSSLVAFFMSAGMFGAITYIPLFVQGVIGVNPSVAGYILTPLMLSVIVTAILSGRLLTKVSYRTFIILGMLLMGTGFWLMSQMDVDTSKTVIVINMIVTGFGMGFIMPTLNTSVQNEVGSKGRGIATSLIQFFRSIGGTIGVSVLGVLMTSRMTAGFSGMGSQLPQMPAERLQQLANPQVLLNESVRTSLPHEVLTAIQNVFVHAMDGVFNAGLVVVALGLIAGLFMGNARMNKASAGGSRNDEAMQSDKASPQASVSN